MKTQVKEKKSGEASEARPEGFLSNSFDCEQEKMKAILSWFPQPYAARIIIKTIYYVQFRIKYISSPWQNGNWSSDRKNRRLLVWFESQRMPNQIENTGGTEIIRKICHSEIK